MKKIQVFGIPNCSSVKKARQWLDDHAVTYEFHDFKKQGLPEADLDRWLEAVGYELVLNRKGTTWRGLAPREQASVVDQASARALLLAYPSLVKRPVLVTGKQVIVGVNPSAWSSVIENN